VKDFSNIKSYLSKKFENIVENFKEAAFTDYTVFLVNAAFIGIVVGFVALLFHFSIEFLNELLKKNLEFGIKGLSRFFAPIFGMIILALLNKYFPSFKNDKGVLIEILLFNDFNSTSVR